MHKKKRTLTLKDTIPYILIFTSIVGLLASFVLTYDKIQLLKDVNYSPSCNINPILSCGSVMNEEQASLLGVPNTIFGLVSFSMLLTFGIILASGAKMARWIWQGAQAAATIGLVFMHYLFFQGVYRINAICPWCFVTWMIVIPTFWYITLYNIREKNIVLKGNLLKIAKFAEINHGNILIVWYLIIIGILIQHFWYYWSTLI